MPTDPIPGQEQDTGSLDALVIAALDGDDPVRQELTLRLALLGSDQDRAAALERYRLNGIPDVWRC